MTDEQFVASAQKALDEGRPFPGLRVRHVKGGTDYRVTSLATIEATMTPAVVYACEKTDKKWVRPLAEFVDGRFVAI